MMPESDLVDDEYCVEEWEKRDLFDINLHFPNWPYNSWHSARSATASRCSTFLLA